MKELVNVRTNVVFVQNEDDKDFNILGCLELVLIYTDGKEYSVNKQGNISAKHKLIETRIMIKGSMMNDLITGLQLHNQKLINAKESANSINSMFQYTKSINDEIK